MAKSNPAYQIDKTGTVTFELTLAPSEISSSYQKILAKHAQSVELKGFRKGKAPLDLVEKSVDKSQLYARVLDDLLPSVYLAFVKKHALNPISEPRVTPVAMKDGEPWSFKIELAVMPEFDLGDYQQYLKKSLDQHDKVHRHDDKETPEHQNNHKLQIIFDTLLKNVDLPVSSLLIEAEAKTALSRLVKELNALNLTVADYAKSQKTTEKELIDQYHQNAALRLRLELILQKLGDVIKPEVKDRQGVLDFLLKL